MRIVRTWGAGGLAASLALMLAAGCGGSGEPDAGGGSASSGGSQAPSSTPSSSGKTLKIGLMPKQVGIPYFNACEVGGKEAAAELGVELVYQGPTEDKSEQQSQMLDTWIIQKFDAVAVACNDPSQISATLARARDAGINVITFDADAEAESSKRQFFVNQVGGQDLAEALVDEMAAQAGESSEVAVVSSSSTAPNQSAWLKAMDAYRATKYPGMKVVVTEYAGENQVTSEEKASAILKAYPNVKGIWGMTSVAFPGAANAVDKAGKAGKVAVVGLGTPKSMKEFVDKGVVKTVLLWNPIDLGYLAVHTAVAVAKGELTSGATSFKAGRLGEMKVNGTEVLLGKPMKFDKENIGKFDF